MPTSGTQYPTGIQTWTPVADLVDQVKAADVNSVYTEITAIENQLGSGGVTTSTWTGTFTTGTTSWSTLSARLLNIEAGVKGITTTIDGGTP
jgi:hypothetical protein